MFLRLKPLLCKKQLLAAPPTVVCIVSITRPEPRVYQPDPPGLMHDDLRLLPPWRGSSLFWGNFPGIQTIQQRLRRVAGTVLSVGSASIAPQSLCTLSYLSTNPGLGLVSHPALPAR